LKNTHSKYAMHIITTRQATLKTTTISQKYTKCICRLQNQTVIQLIYIKIWFIKLI